MSPITEHELALYGPMVSGHEVEQAFTSTLLTWLPDYVIHMASRYDYDSLPGIRSISVWPQDLPEGFPEHQLPHLAVAVPGIAENPVADGSGDYRAIWDVGVAVVVSSGKEEETRRLANVYALAVQGAILQRRSLGGVTRGVDFVGMRPMDVTDKTRSLAAQITMFQVHMDNVVSTGHGPTGPAEPPYEPTGYPYLPDEDGHDVTVDYERLPVLAED